MRVWHWLAASAALALIATPALAADTDAGKKTYDTLCANCHGATGKGDGPTGAALNPKPRDLSSAEWQGSVDDQRIKDVIAKGGPATGLSPMMPPFGHLKGEELENLTAYIRSLGGK